MDPKTPDNGMPRGWELISKQTIGPDTPAVRAWQNIAQLTGDKRALDTTSSDPWNRRMAETMAYNAAGDKHITLAQMERESPNAAFALLQGTGMMRSQINKMFPALNIGDPIDMMKGADFMSANSGFKMGGQGTFAGQSIYGPGGMTDIISSSLHKHLQDAFIAPDGSMREAAKGFSQTGISILGAEGALRGLFAGIKPITESRWEDQREIATAQSHALAQGNMERLKMLRDTTQTYPGGSRFEINEPGMAEITKRTQDLTAMVHVAKTIWGPGLKEQDYLALGERAINTQMNSPEAVARGTDSLRNSAATANAANVNPRDWLNQQGDVAAQSAQMLQQRLGLNTRESQAMATAMAPAAMEAGEALRATNEAMRKNDPSLRAVSREEGALSVQSTMIASGLKHPELIQGAAMLEEQEKAGRITPAQRQRYAAAVEGVTSADTEEGQANARKVMRATIEDISGKDANTYTPRQGHGTPGAYNGLSPASQAAVNDQLIRTGRHDTALSSTLKFVQQMGIPKQSGMSAREFTKEYAIFKNAFDPDTQEAINAALSAGKSEGDIADIIKAHGGDPKKMGMSADEYAKKLKKQDTDTRKHSDGHADMGLLRRELDKATTRAGAPAVDAREDTIEKNRIEAAKRKASDATLGGEDTTQGFINNLMRTIGTHGKPGEAPPMLKDPGAGWHVRPEERAKDHVTSFLNFNGGFGLKNTLPGDGISVGSPVPQADTKGDKGGDKRTTAKLSDDRIIKVEIVAVSVPGRGQGVQEYS